MNPFRTVLDRLNLNHESGTSGNHHWVYLTLATLADAEDADPADNTYANPFRETLHRLRNYSGHALNELATLFSTRVN